MSQPQPRPKYKFETVRKNKPLKIPIIKGNRDNAMKALRAAYAWGGRYNVILFGRTERVDGKWYMVIRKHR